MRLGIVAATRAVLRPLGLTGLDRRLPLHPSAEAALEPHGWAGLALTPTPLRLLAAVICDDTYRIMGEDERRRGPARSIPRRVRSADGVSLAVYETGDPARPTIVAVHGYPDNHAVWDGVVAALADRYHVVTYDVRGTGASDKPGARVGYRLRRLVDDFARGDRRGQPGGSGARARARLGLHPVLAGDHRLASSPAGSRRSRRSPAPRSIYAAPGCARGQRSIRGPPCANCGTPLRGRVPAARAARGESRAAAFWTAPSARRAAHPQPRGRRAAEPPRSDADRINGLALYRANMLAGLRSTAPEQHRGCRCR